MAEPDKYSRTYSFTDYQSGNPAAPLPGVQVDNELENIEQSIGEAIDALGDIRRSDGKLNNGVVTVDSLDAQVAAGVGTGALASAAAAAASADAASDSAVASAASATASAGSATTASGYASNALTHRNAASGFADDAQAMAVSAATARDYANKWATEAEDVNVDDGVNPVGQSAYHWSQKAAASAASVDLPAISANTMLVDNAAGTARETKTFAQVNERLGSFTTKTLAAAAVIDTTITSVRLGGGTTLGDGLGGLYIDTDNGATDTFTSNGGTRTWYRALFDLPTIASGDAGKIVAVNATEDGFALGGMIDSKATSFVDVASAATVDLGAASSTSVNITGTTGIASFGTSAPEGAEYLLKFPSALTITASASIISYTGADIVTSPGMQMLVRREASAWRVAWITPRVDVAGGGASRVVLNAATLTASRTITLPDADVTLSSPALPQNITVFNASGTYTKPAGLKAAKVTVIGGGGGGGGKNNVASTAGGGAGGGTAISILLAASIGATETVTIGAGGAGGTTSGTDGGNGGSSSFGSLVVATGGTGGPGSTGNTSGRQGGVGTTGQLLIRGGRSGASSSSSSWATSCGASILGATGSAGFGASAAPPNSGGGGGPGALTTTNGVAGAAGGSGVIIIEEYY